MFKLTNVLPLLTSQGQRYAIPFDWGLTVNVRRTVNSQSGDSCESGMPKTLTSQ